MSTVFLRLAGAAAATLALAACGGPGGSAYGCTGDTCTATFDGEASQDMSTELGKGAEVEVSDIGKNSVKAGVGDSTGRLNVGETTDLGTLRITLRSIKGESVTLRVVRVGEG